MFTGVSLLLHTLQGFGDILNILMCTVLACELCKDFLDTTDKNTDGNVLYFRKHFVQLASLISEIFTQTNTTNCQ